MAGTLDAQVLNQHISDRDGVMESTTDTFTDLGQLARQNGFSITDTLEDAVQDIPGHRVGRRDMVINEVRGAQKYAKAMLEQYGNSNQEINFSVISQITSQVNALPGLTESGKARVIEKLTADFKVAEA